MANIICDFCRFFHNEKGKPSMMHLLAFMSFFPASWVLVHGFSDTALGWYVSAYVLGAVGGKVSDMIGNRSTGKGKG